MRACQNARVGSTAGATDAARSGNPPLTGRAESPHRRRWAVLRRALRHEMARLHDRRRLLAMAILIFTFGTLAAGLVARGEPAGADARAYWAAVRIWLGAGDPYRPTGPFLPYVYAPWMLPAFAPWALLPWDVAWYVWRGGTILAFLWSVHWAYSRRPLTTALTVLVLAFPIGANLDTGNINLPLALLLFAMPFVGPLAAGAIWAMATWMKWVPVVFVLVMKPRARLWGLLFLAVSILLSLATLPGDDRPARGARRVRPATDPPRLPRLPVGPRAGSLAPDRPVRLAATLLVARPVGRAAGGAAVPRAPGSRLGRHPLWLPGRPAFDVDPGRGDTAEPTARRGTWRPGDVPPADALAAEAAETRLHSSG